MNPPSAYVPNAGGQWSGGSHIVNGVQLVPGATGYDAQAAAPWHQQIAQTDSQLAAHLAKQPAPTAAASVSLSSNPFTYDQKNPYLSQMADSIKSQVTDNLQRNILPNIAGGAQMVGGFGGSRQGVVEANALKDANQGLSNSLASMYYGDYNNAMNRQLQKYGMDQSYNLGLTNSQNSYNLGLGGLQLGNRNTDLNAVQLGMNMVNNSNQGYLGQGQGIYNLGLTAQQAPWQIVNSMNNATQPYTGFGTTTQNNSGSSGAGWLGGAIAGGQLYNLIK